jgi:drug/metabolite transporter (DMT)-like permease
MPERTTIGSTAIDETGTGASERDVAVLREERVSSPAPADGVAARFGPEVAQLMVVMLWSSTFIVSKAVFAEVAPLAFIFARFILMSALAIAVLFVMHVRRGVEWRIAREDLGLFVLAGLTGYTLYQLGFVLGLYRTSPFSSSLLIAMVPLFTLLILAIRGEPVARQGWLGLGVALTGVVIFLLDKRGASSGTLLGDLLSIGAAISFALYGVIARPLVRKYPVETYSAWSALTGSIPLVLISLPETLAQDWQAVSWQSRLTIVYLAVFPVYIAYILWNWAISRRGVAAASSFSLLVPIVAGTLSAILFGEAFGPAKLVGAALVLAGLVIVRVRPLRRTSVSGDARTA